MDPLARLTHRPPPMTTLHLAADPADTDRLAALRERAVGDPDAADELADVQAGLVTIDIELVALGTLFDELVGQAPPTAAQRSAAEAAGRPAPTYDPMVLGPELLAAMVTRFAYSDAPDEAITSLDDSQARVVWAQLHQGDRDAVLVAAIGLCRTSTQIDDLGKG